ncbi:GNAT family N-acetyltransferase [Bacillus sp. ISL-40]|uniref:GNAT family N-acetyltransferase n=1 Tax=unclassified Bacillus (in: firmicutes) TaxID=185979 RepID=UPI001BE59E16|nr:MULTISPECIES: GNAT family N-acetyltransferase [unclassified Bacillus (in: firmicutes)]MBT2695945.1 GNAT family N-acetyltransferase [Bacillus sp. ISL-40]MBT2739699.1 GNAT family N-acetyltransferase [Bacillus sp. ISL-77]
MTVSLKLISKDEKHILLNLYSLYLHDLSEFTDGLDISTSGSFEFDSFELIWERDGLTPYFLKKDKAIVGFLLLLERPFLNKDYDFSINDIFMLKKFRRKIYRELEIVFEEEKKIVDNEECLVQSFQI